MKFYLFDQSNPSGVLQYEKGRQDVIVQAFSAKHANEIAESDGFVYFDGISKGMDCECCNDRWYRVDELDGYETIRPDWLENSKIIYLPPVLKELK